MKENLGLKIVSCNLFGVWYSDWERKMTGYQPVINHHHILVLLNGKYKIYKNLLTYISKPKTVCTQDCMYQHRIHQDCIHQDCIHQNCMYQDRIHQNWMYQDCIHPNCLYQGCIYLGCLYPKGLQKARFLYQNRSLCDWIIAHKIMIFKVWRLYFLIFLENMALRFIKFTLFWR